MSASNITDPSLLFTPDLVTLVTSIYRLTGALWIVPLCLVFYDILLTYDGEIRHFWTKQGGGLTRWLFFLNRYWPAFNLVLHNTVLNLRHPTPTLCVVWFQYTGYSAGAQHLIVGGILTMRIYAIFSCNKKLLIVLLTLYALWIGSETVLIGLVTSRFHSNEALRDIFPGCAPTNIASWSFVYWIPSLAFESLLLILASYKTVKEASMMKSSGLMAVLLRDSVLYFGGVTLFTVANFLAWYIAPLPLYGMFVGCHIGFQSIIGCRMLLNIRETAAAQIAQSGVSVTTMKFNTQPKFASSSKAKRFSAESDDFTMSTISEADTLV